MYRKCIGILVCLLTLTLQPMFRCANSPHTLFSLKLQCRNMLTREHWTKTFPACPQRTCLWIWWALCQAHSYSLPERTQILQKLSALVPFQTLWSPHLVTICGFAAWVPSLSYCILSKMRTSVRMDSLLVTDAGKILHDGSTLAVKSSMLHFLFKGSKDTYENGKLCSKQNSESIFTIEHTWDGVFKLWTFCHLKTCLFAKLFWETASTPSRAPLKPYE